MFNKELIMYNFKLLPTVISILYTQTKNNGCVKDNIVIIYLTAS